MKSPIPDFADLPEGLLEEPHVRVAAERADGLVGPREVGAATEALLLKPEGELVVQASVMGLFHAHLYGFQPVLDRVDERSRVVRADGHWEIAWFSGLSRSEATWAACQARRDAVEGATQRLVEFCRMWMPRAATRERVQALGDALIFVTDDDLVREGEDVMRWIATRVGHMLHRKRFLGDTKLRGQSIGYLDDPIGEGWSLANVADDPVCRVERVLRRRDAQKALQPIREALKDEDWTIAVLHFDGATWAEAAAMSGAPGRGEAARKALERATARRISQVEIIAAE